MNLKLSGYNLSAQGNLAETNPFFLVEALDFDPVENDSDRTVLFNADEHGHFFDHNDNWILLRYLKIELF